MTVMGLASTNAPGAKFLPANFRENCANGEVVEVIRCGRPDGQMLDIVIEMIVKLQP